MTKNNNNNEECAAVLRFGTNPSPVKTKNYN